MLNSVVENQLNFWLQFDCQIQIQDFIGFVLSTDVQTRLMRKGELHFE